jgi:hypothetical protein
VVVGLVSVLQDAFTADQEVILLDASPRGPGGLAGGGWRTPKLNRPVEAGIHGFWRDYRNTFAAIERIGLKLDQVLTPYTPSVLVSESGKVAVAPVLGQDGDVIDSKVDQDFTRTAATNCRIAPPPLDIALLSDFNSASPLSLLDRLSAIWSPGDLGRFSAGGQRLMETLRWHIRGALVFVNRRCHADLVPRVSAHLCYMSCPWRQAMIAQLPRHCRAFMFLHSNPMVHSMSDGAGGVLPRRYLNHGQLFCKNEVLTFEEVRK